MPRPSITLTGPTIKSLLSLQDLMTRESKRVGMSDVASFATRKLRLIAHCESVIRDILEHLGEDDEEELRQEMREDEAVAKMGEIVDSENDERWSEKRQVG